MAGTFRKAAHGFLINATILVSDGTSEDISSSIQRVAIRKDFTNTSFPSFEVYLRTTEIIRDLMRDNDFNLYLRISYYNTESNFENSNNELPPAELGVVYEGIIRIYEKPFTTSVSKKEEDNEEIASQSDSMPIVYYKLVGIPEDLISKNEITLNKIYKNIDSKSAMINMITQIDKDQLYIQDTDNKDMYNYIFVPPLSLIPALRFIDENYVSYKNGLNIFFDSNATYLYSLLSKNIPERNIIECTVQDTIVTEDNDILSIPFIDDDGNIKITYKTLPVYTTDKKVASHELGSKTIMYYYDDNYNIDKKNFENSESFNKIRYIWTPLYYDRIKVSDKSEVMSIVMSNINPEILNPFTNVRILSNKYQNAAGDYTIGSISTVFASGDNVNYFNTTQLALIKK